MIELTYNMAYSELEKLVEQIEADEIQLDTLAEKVQQAKELISFCERRLRIVEDEVDGALRN